MNQVLINAKEELTCLNQFLNHVAELFVFRVGNRAFFEVADALALYLTSSLLRVAIIRLAAAVLGDARLILGDADLVKVGHLVQRFIVELHLILNYFGHASK